MVCSSDKKEGEESEDWFVMSAEWLKDWKMFVNNKRSKLAYGARVSEQRNVGILEPGPITNHTLLNK